MTLEAFSWDQDVTRTLKKERKEQLLGVSSVLLVYHHHLGVLLRTWALVLQVGGAASLQP